MGCSTVNGENGPYRGQKVAQKTIVIGAGIIGASAAYHLQKAGAQVLVIDAGRASATDASFGWINASFLQSEDYFHLRCAGMEAYRALAQDLDVPITQCGCLCWDSTGPAFDAQRDALAGLGYDVEELDAKGFAKREPQVATPPERSLYFAQESVAETGALATRLLQAARDLGAQVVRGVAVTGFVQQGEAVTGVRSTGGDFGADNVLVAAGTASEALMACVDVPLPMLTRPAVVLKTQALPPLVQHVLASDIGEVRQLPSGALLMPAAIGHQSDAADALSDAVPRVADAALSRLQAMFPNADLRWTDAALAYRPVPEDGMPAVGTVRQGLYVATMHSGITLAALMGRQIAVEMLEGPTNETAQMLAPYRPGRFAR